MKKINASELRRRASRKFLEDLGEPTCLVSGRSKEPVAVIVPYRHFLLMQAALNEAEAQVRLNFANFAKGVEDGGK